MCASDRIRLVTGWSQDEAPSTASHGLARCGCRVCERLFHDLCTSVPSTAAYKLGQETFGTLKAYLEV